MDSRILTLLEKNAKLTPENIAAMLDISVEEVEKEIKEFENNKTILGYKAIVDWDKVENDKVTALIEVKVSPSKGEGFDKVAERIIAHPEVKSAMLMSGGFDIALTVEGKTMKDIAYFVAEKLSPIESVLSTATHFILKKYKYEDEIFTKEEDERELLEI